MLGLITKLGFEAHTDWNRDRHCLSGWAYACDRSFSIWGERGRSNYVCGSCDGVGKHFPAGLLFAGPPRNQVRPDGRAAT